MKDSERSANHCAWKLFKNINQDCQDPQALGTQMTHPEHQLKVMEKKWSFSAWWQMTLTGHMHSGFLCRDLGIYFTHGEMMTPVPEP